MSKMILLVAALLLPHVPQDNGSAQTVAENTVSLRPADRSYAVAFEEAKQSRRPLVVVVTATWCPPCQVLKEKTLEPLENSRGFDEVVLAYVDMDKEPALAKKLVGGQGIPQLIVFEKDEEKWAKRNLTGFQTLATVREFIKPKFAANPGRRLSQDHLGHVRR